MKQLAGILILVAAAAAHPAFGAVPPDQLAERMRENAASLSQFQARFNVSDHKVGLPADFASVGQEYDFKQLEEALKSAKDLNLADERKAIQDRWKREMQSSNRTYEAALYVAGSKLRWSEPRRIVSYDGKDTFVVNEPRSTIKDGIKTVPWAHVEPGLVMPTMQNVPFWGLSHPQMPMFTLEEFRRAEPAAEPGWWKVKPTNRYGSAQASAVRVDDQGRVLEFKVYIGDQVRGDTHLLEHWKFEGWQSAGGGEFPGRIRGELFTVPSGELPEFRTAPHRRFDLKLLSLKPSAGEDAAFTVSHPAPGTHVQDDRFTPPVMYIYRKYTTGASLAQLSAYYHKHPNEETGLAPGEWARRSLMPLGLLVLLGALWTVRVKLSRREAA